MMMGRPSSLDGANCELLLDRLRGSRVIRHCYNRRNRNSTNEVSMKGENTNPVGQMMDGLQGPRPLPNKRLLLSVLDRLQKKNTCDTFAVPVDTQKLPDYNEVTNHLMDFGTIRKKLEQGEYDSLEKFEAQAIQEIAKKDFKNLREDRDGGKPELQDATSLLHRDRPPSNKPTAKPKTTVDASGESATPAADSSGGSARPVADSSGGSVTPAVDSAADSYRESARPAADSSGASATPAANAGNTRRLPSLRPNSVWKGKGKLSTAAAPRASASHGTRNNNASVLPVKLGRTEDYSGSGSNLLARSGTMPHEMDGSRNMYYHQQQQSCNSAFQFQLPMPTPNNGIRMQQQQQQLAKKNFKNLREVSDGGEPELQEATSLSRRGRPPSNETTAKPKATVDSSRGPATPTADSSGGSATPAANAGNTRRLPSLRPNSAWKGKGKLSTATAPRASASCGTRNINASVLPVRLGRTEDYSDSWSNPLARSGTMPHGMDGRSTYYHQQQQPSNFAFQFQLPMPTSNNGSREQQLLLLEPVELQQQQQGNSYAYSYTSSLARFAANLGPAGWDIVTRRIEQVLLPGTRFGRGWVADNVAPARAASPVTGPSPTTSDPTLQAVNGFDAAQLQRFLGSSMPPPGF